MDMPVGFTLYGELLFAQHTVFYNKLPDYFLAFDVYDKKNDYFLPRDEQDKFCAHQGFKQVPKLAEGHFKITELFPLIPKVSTYGDEWAEGIVVKKYTKKGYWRAKLVRAEFIKRMEEDEHWMHHNFAKNLLAEAVNGNN
jgi:hypothetical protein